jgi:hypothetical protein
MALFNFGEFYKSFIKVNLIEAPIVGVLLIILFSVILFLLNFSTLIKKNHNIHMMLSVFLAGALFHILCEYSGVNVWYSKDYIELISKSKDRS